MRRLVLDAAALLACIPGEPDSLADVGSGAGFPGLPIAILRPALRVTLVESRERRHHFQRAAVRVLALGNVEPRRARAEGPGATPHAAVVAQALAQPDRALRWMLPWAGPGAWLLLALGPADPGPSITDLAGIEEMRRIHYEVPCGGPRRGLWIARTSANAAPTPAPRHRCRTP